MKNLVLGSLIALGATGCIITSGGDDGPGPGPGPGPDNAYIAASWSIRSLASGTTAPCPPGFDTAALYNQEVNASGAPVGAPIVDLFDCDAGTGTSAPLPPAVFQTWIEITNHNNTSVYAKSASAFVDVTTQDASFAAQLLTDGGYFQFAWNLYGANSNADLTCAEAGSGGVDLTATVSSGTDSTSDVFDCEDGSAVTAGLLEGLYTVSIAALDASDLAIGVAPELTNQPINAPNEFTNLGLIEIPIDDL